MVKTVLRLVLSGTFIFLMVFLLIVASTFPEVFFTFYPTLSRWILSVIATITSVVPFAVCEIGIAVLVIWLLVTLIISFFKHKFLSWLTGFLLTASIISFAFVALWGLNYYAPPMAERMDMEQRQFTAAELREATEYYLEMANAMGTRVERNSDGTMKEYDFSEMAEHAGDGYNALAKKYTCFGGSTVRVKRLIISPIMGKIGMTGGFICLTGESCVSTTTYAAAMPFTMAHEIGHRMAFAREDEANFAGFLACSKSGRSEFLYSGYYMAFKYCYNALSKADPAAAKEVWKGVSKNLAADLSAASRHYEKVRDKTAAKVADTVYSGYLQSFSVESGTQSYGEVTDLLVLWYFDGIH